MRYTIRDGLLEGPGVDLWLLPQAKTQPVIRPWSIINHTQAASVKASVQSAWNVWTSPASGGGEAHLVIDMVGAVHQFMPFDIRADNNYKANSWRDVDGKLVGALSVETQDEGAGSLPWTPWTPAQFESLAQVWAACCHTYDIPVRLPESWDDRGVGYHAQFPEWSKYVGKTCPGAARIAQMPALLARISELIAPPVPDPVQEAPMFLVKQADRPDIWVVYTVGTSLFRAHVTEPQYAPLKAICGDFRVVADVAQFGMVVGGA